MNLDPLKTAKNPALLCSFGKESLVLLDEVMKVRPETTIIWFYDHMNPFAEKIIRERDLTVVSYAPACRYQVEDAVVSEYSIGDASLPLLQDISERGKPVGHVTTPYFKYDYDLTLFGYRKTDSHPLIDRTFEREFQLGPTTMYAPLYDWAEEKVYAALDGYEAYCDDVKPGDLPRVSREQFQARFGFN